MPPSQPPGVLDRVRALRWAPDPGPRAADLAEELARFLGEVLPLMAEIDGSLRDSAGRMPQATLQLRSVTEATALATTEILDRVDATLARLRPLAEHLAEAARPAAAGSAHLLDRLRERLAPADPALMAEVDALFAAHAARAEAAAAAAGLVGEAQDHLGRILVSLQVQDITAQQIAAVNHLIESVRVRLSGLAVRLAASEGVAPPPPPLPDGDAFNPLACYDPSGDRQALADQLLAAPPPGDTPSQREIDALFGGA